MIDLDIRSLLEREDRRQSALNTGSRHYTDGPRWQGPRQDATSELDTPELLYPSQWAERPQRCWNCGAGRASFETTPPYGLVKQGESSCFVCSRVVVRWKDDKTRRPTLTAADMAPDPRGRPPKPKPPRGRCRLCGNETVSERRLRCAACVAAGAVLGGTNTSRLLALLADGRSYSRQDARSALGGLSSSSLQKAVHRLRSRGVPIVAEGECYRLAVMP